MAHRFARRASLAPLLFLLASQAPSQTVCFESFVYPNGALDGRGGGQGWRTNWNAFGSLVIGPSLDGIGGACRVDPNNGLATAWRMPEQAGWPHLTEGGRWGEDGSALWLRLRMRRSPGSQSEYGGLTLYDLTTPVLFIGAPWMVSRYGLEDPLGGQQSLASTSSTGQEGRLTVRLDFGASQDRARLWVNAASFPPTGPSDAELALPDLGFTRFRLAAGTSTPGSWDFDELVLRDAVGSDLGWSFCAATQFNSAGQTAEITAQGSDLTQLNQLTLHATGLPPNEFGIFLASRQQGATPNPGGSQGTLCLGGSIGRFNRPGEIRNSGQVGRFELALDLDQLPTPTGGVAVVPGQTWHFQAWYRDALPGQGATSNFTGGLTVQFQ